MSYKITHYCNNCEKELKVPYLQIITDGRSGLVEREGTGIVTEEVKEIGMMMHFCNTECMKSEIDEMINLPPVGEVIGNTLKNEVAKKKNNKN